MKVEKLDHVHVRVKDIDKAIEALTALLGPDFHTFDEAGSVVVSDMTEQLGVKMARHSCGLHVMEVTNPVLAGERGTFGPEQGVVRIAVKVPDLDEAIAELKLKGARIINEVKVGQLREAIVAFPGIAWAQFDLTAYPGTSSAAAAEMTN